LFGTFLRFIELAFLICAVAFVCVCVCVCVHHAYTHIHVCMSRNIHAYVPTYGRSAVMVKNITQISAHEFKLLVQR